jgi:hypothetical protein
MQNRNYSVMSNSGLSISIPNPSGTMSEVSTQIGSPTLTEPNPADDVNRPVHGWPTLAKVIAQKPDLEAFASFTDLNIKSLLYYQAELLTLRKKLHQLEWEDNRRTRDDSSKYADNLDYLIRDRDANVQSIENKAPMQVPLPEQWKLIERIRTTLDKYSKLQCFPTFL